MADDIVTSLREMATDRARHGTHYDGCAQSHIECAALHACDEIERLRAAALRLTDVGRDLARAAIALLEQRPEANETAYAAVKRWIGADDARRNGMAGAAGTGAQEAGA